MVKLPLKSWHSQVESLAVARNLVFSKVLKIKLKLKLVLK